MGRAPLRAWNGCVRVEWWMLLSPAKLMLIIHTYGRLLAVKILHWSGVRLVDVEGDGALRVVLSFSGDAEIFTSWMFYNSKINFLLYFLFFIFYSLCG